MNWIDIAVLVVWAIVAFWGYTTGLTRMVVSLVIVVLGLALSSRIAEPVGNLFAPLTTNENIQTVAAFLTIIVILVLAGAILSALLRAVLRFIPLFGTANHLAGMAVGVLIGFVLLSGILTALQRFPIGGVDQTINNSTLGRFLADNFDVVIRWVKLIPGDWDQKLPGDWEQKLEELEEESSSVIRQAKSYLHWLLADLWPGPLEESGRLDSTASLGSQTGWYAGVPIYASIKTQRIRLPS